MATHTDSDYIPYEILEVRVSLHYAKDVLASALAYCSYWADVRSLTHRGAKARLREWEREDDGKRGDWIVVELADIQRAIALVIKGFEGARGEIRKQVMDGDVDGPRADAVLQIAALGEVRYS